MNVVRLIAGTVIKEAVRRREIYTIILVSALLIGAVMTIDFFKLEGLNKFYREMALHIMGLATALTVIVLSARQLPREFENKTIYPLLAKPISRTTFLLGKFCGVMLAALFCFGLFMCIFILGSLYLGGRIPWGLFLQYIYLQMLLMSILAALSFWLSLIFNLDAAITLGFVFFAGSNFLTASISYVYDFMGTFAKSILIVLTFIIPQLTLFDLSGKVTHAEAWSTISFKTMSILTIYGLIFTLIYFALAMLAFRRKPL